MRMPLLLFSPLTLADNAHHGIAPPQGACYNWNKEGHWAVPLGREITRKINIVDRTTAWMLSLWNKCMDYLLL